MTTMSQNKLVTVEFHGQSILAILHDGKPYVAMKPICENIGLDWKSQHSRINRNPVMRKGMVIMTMPSAGGEQDATCLPLTMLNGWLFGVDVNRVREAIRPKLIRYQEECFDVLYRHFMPKPVQAGIPGDLYAQALDVEKREAISAALASIAGKSLSYRRKEKKVLQELIALMREEVQLRLALGHISPAEAYGLAH